MLWKFVVNFFIYSDDHAIKVKDSIFLFWFFFVFYFFIFWFYDVGTFGRKINSCFHLGSDKMGENNHPLSFINSQFKSHYSFIKIHESIILENIISIYDLIFERILLV